MKDIEKSLFTDEKLETTASIQGAGPIVRPTAIYSGTNCSSGCSDNDNDTDYQCGDVRFS